MWEWSQSRFGRWSGRATNCLQGEPGVTFSAPASTKRRPRWRWLQQTLRGLGTRPYRVSNGLPARTDGLGATPGEGGMACTSQPSQMPHRASKKGGCSGHGLRFRRGVAAPEAVVQPQSGQRHTKLRTRTSATGFHALAPRFHMCASGSASGAPNTESESRLSARKTAAFSAGQSDGSFLARSSEGARRSSVSGPVRQLGRLPDRYGPHGMIRPRASNTSRCLAPVPPRPLSRWRTAFRPGGPPFDAAAPPLPCTGTDLGRWACDHVVVVVPVRHRPRLRKRDGALALLAPGDGCWTGGPRRPIASHPAPDLPVAFRGGFR